MCACWVSIPFHRDGVSEHNYFRSHNTVHDSTFRFPSNGTAFLNVKAFDKLDLDHEKFLFPSNGKAFLNCDYDRWQFKRDSSVSIPFKRDGVSERQEPNGAFVEDVIGFLFPSTGTAFLNSASTPTGGAMTCSFYSLPPGRRFRTKRNELRIIPVV